jgi:hypothetical protein
MRNFDANRDVFTASPGGSPVEGLKAAGNIDLMLNYPGTA